MTAGQDNRNGSFIRLGAGSATARQVVLVPGALVPLVALDLPDTLRGQAREQVALRRLCDRLGLKPAQIAMRPFAPTGKGKARDGWTRVLAADQGWLTSLQGLSGKAVLPDYLVLPTASGLWTVRAETVEGHAQWLARLGPEDGFTAQPALALAALRQALLTLGKPKAILVEGPCPAGLEALAEEQGVPLVSDPAQLKAMGLDPQVLGHGELACDLRQNPMAARARLARRVLPWRWTALAAMLAAATWAGLEWLELDRATRQTRAITQASTELVQQVFTGGGPVLDARVQVSRALAQMQEGAGPHAVEMDALELIHRVSQVLDGARLIPDMLDYRRGEGLRVVARLPDFAAAERLAAALRAEGLAVDLSDQRSAESGGIRSEFAITPAQEEQP